MGGEAVIKVENVSKKFCRRLRHSMYYGTLDAARGMLGLESGTDVLRPGEFWAVQDVSFELKKGETLGIIGPNGSGKSTLLRLLNGIYQPDRGRIEVRGRVGALIAVGAGFHPLMTGRENIYLNGAILGMSREEINRKFDAIVDFSGVSDFLEAPVKTYSSGMYVRLGFAVAIHCEPDILLVDEVLAVGDAKFQSKCFSRINALKRSGCSIIIVTHNMDAVLRHADGVLLSYKGRIRPRGSAQEIVNKYYSVMLDQDDVFNDKKTAECEENEGKGAFSANRCYNPGETRYGDGRAEIAGFELKGSDDVPRHAVSSGDFLLFRYEVVFREKTEKPIYGYMVRTKDGILVYNNTTWIDDIPVEAMSPGESAVVEFRQNVNLLPGDYFITAGIAELKEDGLVFLDRRLDFVHFVVLPREKSEGIANLFAKVSWKKGTLGEAGGMVKQEGIPESVIKNYKNSSFL